jgi:glycosyltransferase involved in cell wall biosynthesis
MRILHVIDSLVIGGRERRLLELLKEMRKHPEVENRLIVLSNEIQYPYANDIGVKIVRLPRNGHKDLSIFHKLFRLCRSYKPDIVHSWEAMCSIYAVPVAKLLNIGFINGMISDAGPITVGSVKWVRSRLTFPLSDRILANSHAGLLAYQAPAHKSACVHNGFDFTRVRELLPADEIRRRHHIHTPKVVGMVATVDHRKDHLSFTRTAIEICSEREDVSFVALGSGPLMDRCRRMVPGHLKDRILFLGSRSNIESYVQIFDIGMLLTHGEGISNAIMEYMACAKPVIATLGGGTSELVVHGETGFLVSSNTDPELSRYVHRLLDDPETTHVMGLAGKIRIQTHFSIENMCRQTLALYRSCLNARRKSLPQAALGAGGSQGLPSVDPCGPMQDPKRQDLLPQSIKKV